MNAEGIVGQLKQEIAKLQEQLHTLSEKATQDKEELRAALQKVKSNCANDHCLTLNKAKSELGVTKASLVIANAKCQGLEKEVIELRSHISDSCLPKEGSDEELSVQGSASFTEGKLLAASKRRSEAFEESPSKRLQVPGASRQAAPETHPRGRSAVLAIQREDVEGGESIASPGMVDIPPRCMPPSRAPHQAALEAHSRGWGALHLAVERRDATTVKKLLAEGYNPRVQDRDGRTPLHCALDWGNKDIAEILIDADCKNDIQCNDGWSPLHHAACHGDVGIVRKLVASGSRMRLLNDNGNTPLHSALSRRKKDAAEFLVEMDSENNIPNKIGMTPLHFAVKEGFASIVQKLLLGGICPHIKNLRGEYPLYTALSKRRDDIAKMILAMYAFRNIEINRIEIFTPYPFIQLGLDQIKHCMDLLSEGYTEVQRMKETKIGGSAVSYHEIAIRHVRNVAMCLRNESIRKVLLCDRAMSDFPFYADLLTLKVRRAEERRALSLECFSMLHQKLPTLPRTIIDIVLGYLTERDMQLFINAIKFRS